MFMHTTVLEERPASTAVRAEAGPETVTAGDDPSCTNLLCILTVALNSVMRSSSVYSGKVGILERKKKCVLYENV